MEMSLMPFLVTQMDVTKRSGFSFSLPRDSDSTYYKASYASMLGLYFWNKLPSVASVYTRCNDNVALLRAYDGINERE